MAAPGNMLIQPQRVIQQTADALWSRIPAPRAGEIASLEARKRLLASKNMAEAGFGAVAVLAPRQAIDRRAGASVSDVAPPVSLVLNKAIPFCVKENLGAVVGVATTSRRRGPARA